MPYRKKTKKRYGRKRVRSIAKISRMVKSMRPEVKEKTYSYDNINGTNFNSISYGAGTTMGLLASGITQGTGDGQRVGNRIKVIGIKLYLAFQNASADNYNNLRFILLRPKTDKLSVGATLIQNIMSGTASGGTQWAAPIDTDRYKAYVDKMYNLYNRPADGSTTTTIQPTRFLKKFVKVRANMQWDEEGNLTKDFILVGISDSAAIAHPGCVAGHVKVYYTDN